MGRHQAPDDDSFRRSVLRAAAGAAVAVAVTVGVVVLLATIGGPQDAASSGAQITARDAAGLQGRGTPELSDPTEAATAAATQPPEPDRRTAGRRKPARAAQKGQARARQGDRRGPGRGDRRTPVTAAPVAAPPQETTVQVLDGVGNRVQADSAAQTLRDLGYQVIVINPAGLDYDTTTVLATAGHEHEAAALRARDGRFGRLDRNRTLDQDIDLHVVVGRDWSG